MHRDSIEADKYRVSLIEHWCKAAGIDMDDLSKPVLTAFIAATNDFIDRQEMAMLDPGEEIDA